MRSNLARGLAIAGLLASLGGGLPTDIAKGQTRTAVVSYTITSAAQDGDSFQVFLDADIPD